MSLTVCTNKTRQDFFLGRRLFIQNARYKEIKRNFFQNEDQLLNSQLQKLLNLKKFKFNNEVELFEPPDLNKFYVVIKNAHSKIERLKIQIKSSHFSSAPSNFLKQSEETLREIFCILNEDMKRFIESILRSSVITIENFMKKFHKDDPRNLEELHYKKPMIIELLNFIMQRIQLMKLLSGYKDQHPEIIKTLNQLNQFFKTISNHKDFITQVSDQI